MSRSKTRHSAMKTVTRTRGARRSGAARRPYAWLGAGAVGVGVWAALAGGLAHAEGAAADSTGPGSVGRSDSATANSRVARGPSRVAAARVARPASVSSGSVSVSHPTPAAVAAVASRVQRELGGVARRASTVPSVYVVPSVDAVTAARAAAVAANPIADLVRVLVGNGTADNPNAGILAGNGYTYTSYVGACLSGAC